MSKSERDKTSYLRIKRLFLRIQQEKILSYIFDPFKSSSLLNFTLRYYDMEQDVRQCFYSSVRSTYGGRYIKKERDYVDGLSNFFCSLYGQDKSLFQQIFSFVLKEAESKNIMGVVEMSGIYEELRLLGYVYDGNILKTTSGHPIIEQKMSSMLEEELSKLNPKLLDMRNGAVESLLSNKPDKARHVAVSSRAMINTLLRELVPEISGNEDSKIRLRIEKLFGKSKSTMLLIDDTTKLIQSLNKVQSKGDHSNIDNNLAFFIFELTEKLIYFILTYKDK